MRKFLNNTEFHLQLPTAKYAWQRTSTLKTSPKNHDTYLAQLEGCIPVDWHRATQKHELSVVEQSQRSTAPGTGTVALEAPYIILRWWRGRRAADVAPPPTGLCVACNCPRYSSCCLCAVATLTSSPSRSFACYPCLVLLLLWRHSTHDDAAAAAAVVPCCLNILVDLTIVSTLGTISCRSM